MTPPYTFWLAQYSTSVCPVSRLLNKLDKSFDLYQSIVKLNEKEIVKNSEFEKALIEQKHYLLLTKISSSGKVKRLDNRVKHSLKISVFKKGFIELSLQANNQIENVYYEKKNIKEEDVLIIENLIRCYKLTNPEWKNQGFPLGWSFSIDGRWGLNKQKSFVDILSAAKTVFSYEDVWEAKELIMPNYGLEPKESRKHSLAFNCEFLKCRLRKMPEDLWFLIKFLFFIT